MVEIFIVLLGLVFGSFLGMLQYRLPLQISLFSPRRSMCPSCEKDLKWYENIPLLSFIILKGRCKTCKEPISIRYPVIEFVTALITFGLYIRFGISLEFIVIVFVSYTLILLSFIDLQYKAVPDYLLLLVLLGGFFYTEFSYLYCLVFAGVGVLLDFFVSFYIQNIKAKLTKDESLRTQKALGEGDIPIFALIGGVLGLQNGITALFLGALLALLPSILSQVLKDDIELPFIPFLALGFFIVLFFGNILTPIVEKVTHL